MFCSNCGAQIQDGARFCANCGQELKSTSPPASSIPPQPAAKIPAGIASDLKDLAPGEVVLMDTGTFPISYVKNLMTSVNGKLYLTNLRLVFKASALQGVGGVSTGGIFVPNTKDAGKAKGYFSVPLDQITGIEAGLVTLIIQAGEKYKFGAMRKTKEWDAAINQAAGRG
jgi:hypothetical protein